MTLPCLSEDDRCTTHTKLCNYRQQADNGLHSATWVETNKCDTLIAKREGWKEAEECYPKPATSSTKKYPVR